MCRYLQKWGLIKWSYICLCTKHPPFKTLYTSTVYSGKVLKCLLQILCISMSQLEGTDVTHWPMSRYCHITQHPHHTPRSRPRPTPTAATPTVHTVGAGKQLWLAADLSIAPTQHGAVATGDTVGRCTSFNALQLLTHCVDAGDSPLLTKNAAFAS